MSKQDKPRGNSSFHMVPIGDLHVDPEAQRPLAPAWVKARVPLFDVDQLGYIVVNKRANGKLYLVDGQHRVELMRAVGWADQTVHAEVFEGLSQAEEAALFNARNDRKAVTLYNRFRVSVTAGDHDAKEIDRIVREHGLVVSDQLRDGHICAVEALQRVYYGSGIASAKEGPTALGKALDVLIQSWGKQASSVNGKVVQALGMVFLRYDGAIHEKELIKKLAPVPGGAPGLLSRGKALQELRGRPLHHCIASIVTDLYNKGRKTGKLDAWES